MPAPDTNRWVGIGLLGLPLYGALTFWSSFNPQPDPNTQYGALTFWSSFNPQPDPNTQYEAWSRFVTTDHYVLTHVFGSILGLVFAIFGTFALGVYLANSRAGRLGLVAMVVTVFGCALFLPLMGVSTFAAPQEGQAYLAGIDGLSGLPTSFADTVMLVSTLLFVVLLFVGNVMLGVAVWRSGKLPRWAGALWAAAPVLMYPLGLVYAMTIGARSTPPTVLGGALLMVVGGAWISYTVLRRPSAATVRATAQPRTQ